MDTPAPQEHPVSLSAGILSYLVPGLGQISQGRTGKGVLFMVVLLGLFHAGEAMGGWKSVYIPVDEPRVGFGEAPPNRVQRLRQLPHNLYQRWHYLGQFWIGVAAWPALWQYFDMPLPPKEKYPFLHDLQGRPEESKIQEFWTSSDKTPDLGWIYTVIAGVLNILVIYDAYAGPVHRDDSEAAKKGIAKKPEEAPA